MKNKKGVRKVLEPPINLYLQNGPKGGKNKKKNLATCWIDYRKAYDVVPHS